MGVREGVELHREGDWPWLAILQVASMGQAFSVQV